MVIACLAFGNIAATSCGDFFRRNMRTWGKRLWKSHTPDRYLPPLDWGPGSWPADLDAFDRLRGHASPLPSPTSRAVLRLWHFAQSV